MKSFILLFLLLITGHMVFSQSWNPFVKGQNSYFEQQDETATKVESFLMDSTKSIGNRQFLYFNAKSELKNACNSSFRQAINKMYWVKNPYKIDSLLLTGDSLLFISTVMSKLDTFIFKPFCKLNESWVTNGITIRCAEIGEIDILGEKDSIKTFKCSGTGYNAIEFILSKSHGFTKFLPFNEFLYYSPSNRFSPYFELIGYRKDNIKKGYVQPDFNDYFHLSAGDVLYWRVFSDPLDVRQHGYTKYHIDTVKYSYLSRDSVFYKFRQTNFDENGIIEYIGDYASGHLRKDEGKIVSNQSSWFGIKYGKNEMSDIFFLNSLRLKIENEDSVTFVDYYLPGFFLNTSSCETHSIIDYDMSVGYSTREGKIYQGSFSWGEYSNTLIGSIINGVKHGTTEIPTGINTLAAESLRVYPNPVKNYLTINYPNHSISQIEIYDVIGNLMITEKINDKIDLSELAKGVYILKISDTNKNIMQVKIIKQ